MSFVLSSLSEGLLWSIMAIGVYLTFRILDIADMTAEGAFPLGAAVVVSQIQAGTNPWICLLYTSPSPRDLSTSRMPSSA